MSELEAIMEMCKSVFNDADENKSGFLEKKEMESVLNALMKQQGSKQNISKAELDKSMSVFDLDKDGKISLEESIGVFMPFFAKEMGFELDCPAGLTKDIAKVYHQFKKLDKNGDGKISQLELKLFYAHKFDEKGSNPDNYSSDKILRMIEEYVVSDFKNCDHDKDKKLDYLEFFEMYFPHVMIEKGKADEETKKQQNIDAYNKRKAKEKADYEKQKAKEQAANKNKK